MYPRIRHTLPARIPTPCDWSGYLTAACVALVALACVASPAYADHPRSPGSAPRAVSLSDASVPPSFLRLVKPRRAYVVARQCASGALYSDVSAYGWRGGRIGRQHWNRARTITYWNTRTGRVTFDGIVWQNNSRRAVLIAGWCD